MPLERHDEAGSPAQDLQPGRALLDRVKASGDLSRAPRLRQLLDYLCERSLSDPGAPLNEEQIGVDVFGRPRGYDTGNDTIVRVQVSQLRRKLEHYFLSEGAVEPVVIDLPKRSYLPVFRPREQAPPEEIHALPAANLLPWKAIGLCLAILLMVSLVSAGWLALENSGLRDRLSPKPSRTPFRDHFWSQLFQGGHPTQVVTSDGNAMMLCDFLNRLLTPAEYTGSGYPTALIDAEIRNPATRKAVKDIMGNFLTNLPDLRVANQLSLLAAASGARLNIVFARDFRYNPQTPDNLVLLSHRKANPWVGLFEERMNFRYEFDAKAYRTAIVNLKPGPAEQAKYPVEWGVQTYALIARLRKPMGEGTVLLLEGTDVAAAEAGCNLLTDEARLKALYERLGIRPSGPVPDFEILLRARQLRSAVRDYEMVAHRLVSR